MGFWGDVNNNGYVEAAIGSPGSINCPQSSSDMLKSPEGNGSCASWAFFLNELFRAHGFNSNLLELNPKSPLDYLVVKNCQEVGQAEGGLPIPLNIPFAPGYGYVRILPPVIDPPKVPGQPQGYVPKSGNFYAEKKGTKLGLPAQGGSRWPNSDPAKVFLNHFLTDLNGVWFDPSYGTSPMENPDNLVKLSAYVNNYIAFFGELITNPNNNQMFQLFRKPSANQGSDISAKLIILTR